MNWKKLGILLAILAVVGGFWTWDSRRLKKVNKAHEQAREVFTKLTTDDVQKVQVERLGEPTVVAVRSGDKSGESTWKITEPVQSGADGSVLESMVATLLGAKKETVGDSKDVRVIDATPGEVSEYGLDPIETTVTLASATKSAALQLGLLTATEKDAYARLPGKTEIFLVPKSVYTAVDKKLFDLRDKTLVKLTNYKVDRIRIVDPTREVAVKKVTQDLWRITSTPVTYRADRSQITDFINDLNQAKAVKFIDKPEKDLAAYGLTDGATVVEVWEGDAKRTLRFGRFEDTAKTHLFAKVEGHPEVLVVGASVLAKAPIDVEALRSLDLFATRNWDADKVVIDAASPAGTYTLTKSASGDWFLNVELAHETSGESRKLDFTAFTKFYDVLGRMKAAGFVDDSSEAESLLAHPDWKITVNSQRNGLTEELTISRLEPSTQTRFLRRNDSKGLMMMYEEDLDEFRKGFRDLLAARPSPPPMTESEALAATGEVEGATP